MLLLRAALCLVAGVVVGAALPPLAIPALVGAGIVAMALALRPSWALWAVPVLALLLGLGRAPHQTPPGPHDLAYYNGQHVQTTGTVSAEPDMRATGANYVISVSTVTVAGRVIHVAGAVQVHTSRSVAFDYGDGVTLTGRLETPPSTGTVHLGEVLAEQGIYSTMRFPRSVDTGPAAGGLFAELMKIRVRLEAGINAALPEPQAALLIAITLGAHSASLGSFAPILVATGLIHIVAISGIKVAMVAGTLNQLGKIPGRRLPALLLSLSGLTAYILLTGATPSGVRSGIMWALVFIAAYLGRSTVTLVSLALAAAVMVVLEPALIWNTGFQLSVVGTFAIVALSDRISLPLRHVPSPFRESLAVTLAAQIGTFPLVVAGFHELALTGPLANAIALPLLPALIVCGFALGAASGLAPVAYLIGAIAYALLNVVVQTASWLSRLPGAFPITNLPAGLSVFYYVALGMLAIWLLRRAQWAPIGRWNERGRELMLAGVVGMSVTTLSLFPPTLDGLSSVTVVAGTSSFLVQSAGRTVLVAGRSDPFKLLYDLGRSLPYADRTIDLVVVTDPRAKTVGALEGVLQHYHVASVLDVGAEYPSTEYARWRAELRSAQIPVLALRTRVVADVGGIRISALGPDALYPDPRDSIGLTKVSVGQSSILFAGAASKREQTEAIFRPVNLRADVLVVSGATVDPSFVEAVRARRVWSAGLSSGPGTNVLREGQTIPLAR